MNQPNKGMQDVIALIPARGGSKGVPRKNMLSLGGYPLVAYPIAAAQMSKHISRTIVVTDDKEIGEAARRFGAETPFEEPKELAQDFVRDIEWIEYTIDWLREHEGGVPEYVVELRPTTPLRHPSDLDKAIELFKSRADATSLRSGHEIQESPYKMFGLGTTGFFEGLFPDDPRPEYYNLPRQTFPPVYQPDGYIDIMRASHIEKTHNQHGDKQLAFLTPDVGEIDTPHNVDFVRFKLEDDSWEIYEWLKQNFPQEKK
jgi:CMP-N,N'-diacetyllegionaminic acid synthase